MTLSKIKHPIDILETFSPSECSLQLTASYRGAQSIDPRKVAVVVIEKERGSFVADLACCTAFVAIPIFIFIVCYSSNKQWYEEWQNGSSNGPYIGDCLGFVLFLSLMASPFYCCFAKCVRSKREREFALAKEGAVAELHRLANAEIDWRISRISQGAMASAAEPALLESPSNKAAAHYVSLDSNRRMGVHSPDETTPLTGSIQV